MLTCRPAGCQAGVSRHGKCYRRKPRRAINSVTQAGVPEEGTRVGPQARHEYLAQLRDRYVRAARKEAVYNYQPANWNSDNTKGGKYPGGIATAQSVQQYDLQ